MSEITVTPEQREVLELLAQELQEQLEQTLDDSVQVTRQDRLVYTCASLENLEHVAQLVGLTGLAGCCAQLRGSNLEAMQSRDPNPEEPLLLDSWPVYMLDYVQQLMDDQVSAESIEQLLNFLGDSGWPSPLLQEEREPLQRSLESPVLVLPETETEEPEIPRLADQEQLLLAPADDLNPQLYEGLMLELPQQVEQFTRAVTAFNADHSKDNLNSAQRIAHTVKGSANVVGISGLADFMHYSEDLLDQLEQDSSLCTPAMGELLLEIADTLASLLDHLLDGTQPGDEAVAVLQKILDCLHGQPPTDATGTSQETATSVVAPSSEESTTQAPESAKAQIRVDERAVQTLLNLAGEASIGNHRLSTQSHQVRQTLQQMQMLHNKLLEITDELGDLVEVRNLFAQGRDAQDDNELDPLELDRYNELHSFYHQLQEYSADFRDLLQGAQGELLDLDDITQSQQTNHRDSQERLLGLLTVPAQTIESRLQRCVRQASRLTGKQVQLDIEGGDCRLDSQTLQQLTDPLMHLLRNAVDHGIESPELRRTRGKPETGRITLRFEPSGQATRIQLRDDGAGLDREQILERARRMELPIEEDAPDDWIQSVIFLPGFSTRDQVSQTSGRGVGLDVVADQVTGLKGKVSIHSQAGEGSQFTLEIPNTLLAEHQLLVNLGEQTLALSSRGIQQLLFMDPEYLSNDGDQLFYQYQGHAIPVLHLAQVAELPDPPATDTRRAQAVLLMEIGPGNRQGLLVDQVLASREMVVKPLPPFVPETPGLLGATILGDGRVAPVLDTFVLVQNATGDQRRGWWQDNLERQAIQERLQRPLALVIDDSLSSRRSLAQFVSDMGMDVVTARDGFDAIEKLRDRAPTLILVDMEMPRMNGLEFTAHLRSQELLCDIPVIMITSRNTEKHRQLADAAGVDSYLNKPFSDDELLSRIQETLH